MGRTGCGVPRVCAMHASSREAPESRPPPLRADTRSSQTVKPDCFIPCGTGPTTAAVERREASISIARDARRLASACGPASLARERVPLHPSACRRSAPLVSMRGRWQTSEEQMPREQDEACANYTAVIPGRAKGASPESISLAAAYGFRARRFAAPRNDRWKCPISPRLPSRSKPPTLARPATAEARQARP